jgi:hypothetical protein
LRERDNEKVILETRWSGKVAVKSLLVTSSLRQEKMRRVSVGHMVRERDDDRCFRSDVIGKRGAEKLFIMRGIRKIISIYFRQLM